MGTAGVFFFVILESHCSGQFNYQLLKCLSWPLSSLWISEEVKDLPSCLCRPWLLHQHGVVWSFVQSQECEFPLTPGSPVTGSFLCGYRGSLVICRVMDVASEICAFSYYFGQSWGIPGLFRRSPGAAVESALPQQLLSSPARAVCNRNVPGWGWMNKSSLTFDPGDFGIQ